MFSGSENSFERTLLADFVLLTKREFYQRKKQLTQALHERPSRSTLASLGILSDSSLSSSLHSKALDLDKRLFSRATPHELYKRRVLKDFPGKKGFFQFLL